MTRDTAVAIWYRRLDPGCFASRRQATDADGRPFMETSHDAQTGTDATVHAARLTDDWSALANDRRGWAIDAVADRL